MPAVNNASLYGKNSSGEWKAWDTVYAKDNGVWKFGMVVWVKKDGEWEQVFVRLTAATNLTASFSAGSKTVTLNWTPGLGADGFRVYNGATMIKDVAGGTTSTTTVELDYYTNHSITVKAYSGAIESDPTNAVAVYNTITAPTNLTYTGGVGTKAITLNWTAGSGQQGYYILRNGVIVGNTTGTSFAYTLPDYYTGYTMSVQGYYNANTSGSATTGASASMAAPTITGRSIGQWGYSYAPHDPSIKEEWDGNNPTYTLSWSAVDGASSYDVVRSDGAISYNTTSTSQTIGIGTERSVTRTWIVRARHATGNVGPYSSGATFTIGRPQLRSDEFIEKISSSTNNPEINRCMLNNPVGVQQPAGSYLVDFRAQLTASFTTTLIDNNGDRQVYIDRPNSYGGDISLPQSPNPFDTTYTYTRSATNNYGYNAGYWGVRVSGPSSGGWSTFGLPTGNFYIGYFSGTGLGYLRVRLKVRSVSQTEVANGTP